MNLKSTYMNTIQKVKEIQEEFSKKVITKDVLPKNITKICGVDVSYKYDRSFCACVDFKFIVLIVDYGSAYF